MDAIYFNSTANVVINLNKYGLCKSFREILYRLDNWINEEPDWITEYIDGEFINIYIYNPLSRSTYIELADKLKYPIKVLINTKNDKNKCFFWCHVVHLNP